MLEARGLKTFNDESKASVPTRRKGDIILPPERGTPEFEWANASRKFEQYDAGPAVDRDGNVYEYPWGVRLLMGEQDYQVMDTAEAPWAKATINEMFNRLSLYPEFKPRFLELGFGLGLSARLAIQKLMGIGGGEYHVVELNHEVADDARLWREEQLSAITNQSRHPGLTPEIDIFIHEGDGKKILEHLHKRRKLKFNLILADTFDPNNPAVHDVQNAGLFFNSLYQGGVLGVFPWYQGFDEETVEQGRTLSPRQSPYIRPYFPNGTVVTSEVSVATPPSYKYLTDTRGNIVTTLPIMTCQKPRKQM